MVTELKFSNLTAEPEADVHEVYQLCWIPSGLHSAQQDCNDPPPLHRNSAGKSCSGCPGAATIRGNHKDIVTP